MYIWLKSTWKYYLSVAHKDFKLREKKISGRSKTLLVMQITRENSWNTWYFFSSVQLLSHVWLFATPWTAARQASLSITNSWILLKLMSIESVTPSNHLILCRPLLLLPSIFSSIRVFSNESVLYITWPKYWSFSFSISPSMNIQDWFPLRLTGLISYQSKWPSRVFSNTTVQKHQFFITQLSLWSNSHIHTWPPKKR